MSKRPGKENTNENENQNTTAQGAQDTTSSSASGGTPYAKMVALASRLATGYRTGGPLRYAGPVSTAPEFESKYGTFELIDAGITVYSWLPTLGVSYGEATAPINMAIKSMNSMIRSHNSGARNYEASDLGIYMVALDSLFSIYYAGVRVLGILNRYTPFNAYYPRAIVEAMGFDYDDFVRNQPNMQFFLANTAAKLTEFAMPPVFRMFNEHMVMNSALYADAECDQAQLYAFVQDAYFSYERVDEVKGLTPRRFNNFGQGRNATFDDYCNLVNDLVEAFMNSTDVSLISGDILKAYGSAAIIQLPIIDASYTVPVLYDRDMLSSISNMFITPVDLSSIRVVDDNNGNLSCVPKFTARGQIDDLANAGLSLKDAITRYYDVARGIGFMAGNPREVSFNDVEVTNTDVLAALRFRPWINEDSISYTLLSDALTEDEKAEIETWPEYEDHSIYCYRDINYDLKHVGTEVITAAHVATLLPPERQVLFLDNNSRPLVIGGDAPSFGYARLTNVSGGIRSSAFRYDLVTGEQLNGGVSTFYEYALYALYQLARFDWHHGISIGTYDDTRYDLGEDKIIKFIPSLRDTKVHIPVDENSMEQLTTAKLYYNFFM